MEQTTKVVTGKVRFSYVAVFQPKAMDEKSEPKYSVSIIIPKSDKATLDRINKAIEAAKVAGKAKLADKTGKIPANIKIPLRDGDTDRPDDEAYADSFFINASSNRRPGVVDAQLNEIIAPEDFYSGCYGRASLNFYAFNANGNKGIAAGLQNLQKLAEGEPLAGASAEQDFGGDNEYKDSDML